MLNLRKLHPDRIDELDGLLEEWHKSRVLNCQAIGDLAPFDVRERTATAQMEASRKLHGFILGLVPLPLGRIEG